jgi:hypothetical protein
MRPFDSAPFCPGGMLGETLALVSSLRRGELSPGEGMSDQWGYPVEEVAAILKVSKHTVFRRAKELGAVQIPGNEGSIKLRPYRVLRCPRVALEKYLTKLSGHPVVLSSLTIPQTRRSRANLEETATRKLAEIASANSNGVPERAVLARIARSSDIVLR